MGIMSKKTNVAGMILAVVLVGLVVLIARGGDLEPSGPPGSTMKTLDEVEPRIPIGPNTTPGGRGSLYSITAPGSYYLTGNFTVNFEHGIEIDSNDVTLDLMGYEIRSSWMIALPGKNVNFDGIRTIAKDNIEIRNGTIVSETHGGRKGFRHGIRAELYDRGNESFLLCDNVRVINVRVVGSREVGIYLYGQGHLVKDCASSKNGQKGIYVDTGSRVVGNTAHENGWDGIYTGNGCIVKQNAAYKNGTVGIFTGRGCTVIENCAYRNGRHGIWTGYDCLVDRNAAYDNNQDNGGYPNMNYYSTCTYGINETVQN